MLGDDVAAQGGASVQLYCKALTCPVLNLTGKIGKPCPYIKKRPLMNIESLFNNVKLEIILLCFLHIHLLYCLYSLVSDDTDQRINMIDTN